ncbi:hypothetical protein FRC10_000735 [Ceratobasidium sp. 414]|nr:hypothetical protein FRC10_000735 [Ceratobasidium sp. 414]
MSLPTSFTFNNGQKIPSVGLGYVHTPEYLTVFIEMRIWIDSCWMGVPGEVEACYEMCLKGLKLGYRHLDTAFGYSNEEAVGRAIRDSGVPREEIFLTTKLAWKHHGSVAEALDLSLKDLGVDYVDLYLIHWPQAADPVTERIFQPEEHPTYVETWKAMEALLPTGKVKSIGVSNFSIKTLDVLLSQATVVPATNQIEVHPSLPWFELVEYCESKGILVTAYSSLGRNPKFFSDYPEVKTVVESEGITIAQLLLSWGVQRGIVVIPKSVTESRLKENMQVVKLSDKAMGVLNNFHKTSGVHATLVFKEPADGKVFDWTFDQLGWGMDEKGNVISS